MPSTPVRPTLRNKDEFRSVCGVAVETYRKAGLDWKELGQIYADYLEWMPSLAAEGQPFLTKLLTYERIRAVYARPKDPDHLIKKLIIRSAKKGSPYARKADYLTTVTDLLGLRALHVFKEDWPGINDFICAELDVIGSPEAKLREDDPPEVIKMYTDGGCKIAYTAGYRSVHYSIQIRCRRKDLVAELQVRTLFEEAWGEASHQIDYPIPGETPLLVQYVSLMGDLACFSDEIASAALILRKLETMEPRRGSRAQARRAELWALFQQKTEFLLSNSPAVARLAIPPNQVPADLARRVLKRAKAT